MSFSGDVSTFGKETKIGVTNTLRKIAVDMTKEITLATPVDTGTARSNWFVGFNVSSDVELKAVDKKGSVSINRAVEFAKNIVGDCTFYIVNNLPYIRALEFGHSKIQAPNGMVRIVVSRWKTKLKNKVI